MVRAVAVDLATDAGVDRVADICATEPLTMLTRAEVVCAPGLDDANLLETIFDADLAAFGAQSPELATRYRPT